MQVDESRVTLPLRFLLGNDDDGPLQVNVPRLDMPSFLRPRPGAPEKQKQVAEWVAFLNPGKDNLEVLESHGVAVSH